MATLRVLTTLGDTMKKIGLLMIATLSGALYAQTLTGISIDKTQAQTGQNIQASVAFDAGDSANCGVRVDWGDGTGDDVKINDASKLPYVSAHSYAKAGDYTVSVTPKKVTSLLGCVGKAKSAMVKIVAPAVVAAAPAAVAPAAPAAPAPAALAVAAPKPVASAPALAKPALAPAASACPTGWTLNAKSVNKKTKAFTCTAKPGTAAPEKKLACEGDTGYFENAKKGTIGCRI